MHTQAGDRSIELLARQTSGQRREAVVKRQQRENERAGKKDPKTVKELLGDLYGDWKYLDEILNDENSELQEIEEEVKFEEQKRKRLIKLKRDALKGGNPLKQVEEDDDKLVPKDRYSESHRKNRKYFSEMMMKMTQNELIYLNERVDFWMQQKPPRRQPTELKKSIIEANKILRVIESIEEGLTNGKYDDCIDRGEKLLKRIKDSQVLESSQRFELNGTVYSLIGNAYYELFDYDKALEYHEKDMDISEKRHMEEARSRALDNLGRTYAKRGEYAEAMKYFEQKVPLITSHLEGTWLYHELGRCYLETGNFTEAKACAKKSMYAATKNKDTAWQLNASVLKAQADVELQYYDDALESFEKARRIADNDNDKEAKAVICKAIEDLNKKLGRAESEPDGREAITSEEHTEQERESLSRPTTNERSRSRGRSRSRERSRSPTRATSGKESPPNFHENTEVNQQDISDGASSVESESARDQQNNGYYEEMTSSCSCSESPSGEFRANDYKYGTPTESSRSNETQSVSSSTESLVLSTASLTRKKSSCSIDSSKHNACKKRTNRGSSFEHSMSDNASERAEIEMEY